MAAFKGVRIIELAEDVAGEYCGKLLADFGAEVIKIERPGAGSPTRSLAPVIQGKDGRKESGVFAYLNTNKQSVTLDLNSQAGIAKMRELIASAAGVIDDHDEDWLAARNLVSDKFAADFPNVVFCAISNFGQGAPADFRVTRSTNVFHASGWGYHTPTPHDDDKPPLKGPGRFIVDYDTGLDAAMGMVAALVNRERTGMGDYLDLAKLDVLVSRGDTLIGRMLTGEIYAGPNREAYIYPSPSGPFTCADGSIYLYLNVPQWKRMVVLLKDVPWVNEFDPYWVLNITPELHAKFNTYFQAWVGDKKKDEICLEAQNLGISMVQINDAADLLRNEQFKFRGFFQDLEHPILGTAAYPTVPYKMSATPAELKAPAPLLGQHNHLLSAPTVPAQARAPRAPNNVNGGSRGGPLAGIRVVELTKVWAGPYAGKLLAFLGAEVIKVESMKKLDDMRVYRRGDINKAPIFRSLNPEVLSMQLDMKTEKGVECLRDLVAKSDIVLENLKAGALDRAGVGYESMKAVKKDIILVSLKMYGSAGPLADQVGYAPCFAALGGLNSLVGYEGEPPRGVNQSYGDSTAGAAMAFGALAALLHREQTGEGQYVDLSATEAMTTMIGDLLVEYGLTGKIPRHEGNRHAEMGPHGVYPCVGGEWISIAVATDDEWAALCDALGASELKNDARFGSLASRQANTAALDDLLSALTKKHHAAVLAARLRQTGVPATKCQSSLDMIGDQHLWQRRTYLNVHESSGEARAIVASPWHFARSAANISRGAPLLGEHNAYVYCDILGRSQREFEDLIKEGVVN